MDKFVQLKNIESEYTQICKMAFWGRYNEKLSAILKLATNSKKGVSDKPKEDFRYYLGVRQALEDVLSLPNLIMTELQKKANEEEGIAGSNSSLTP